MKTSALFAMLAVFGLLATEALVATEAAGQSPAASDKEPLAIPIGAAAEQSCVPAPLRQGVVVPTQSVSTVDVSDDGQFIAVGTMGFRHHRNFWLLSAETGEVAWGRYVDTWAPVQV